MLSHYLVIQNPQNLSSQTCFKLLHAIRLLDFGNSMAEYIVEEMYNSYMDRLLWLAASDANKLLGSTLQLKVQVLTTWSAEPAQTARIKLTLLYRCRTMMVSRFSSVCKPKHSPYQAKPPDTAWLWLVPLLSVRKNCWELVLVWMHVILHLT